MSECTNGEMRDLLPELVSGRLSAEMRLAVEAHVAECDECAEELELLRALRPALMRGPTVDAAKIAAAVRAQVPASAQRGAARPAPLWRLRLAAAAILAVSAIGIAFAMRARRAAPEVAVMVTPVMHSRHSAESTVVAPRVSPKPSPNAPAPRATLPVPTPEQRVAVAPATSPATSPRSMTTTVANAGVLDNLTDLSDDDLKSLTASLDGLSAVPTADPAPDIDPLGATLDDRSTGGSR